MTAPNDNGKLLMWDPSLTKAAPGSTDLPSSLADCTCGVPSREQIPPTAEEARRALSNLVRMMEEEGLNPVTQLSGYIIAEDPTYLPEEADAHALTRRVGRDKLLSVLIEVYLENRRLPSDRA